MNGPPTSTEFKVDGLAAQGLQGLLIDGQAGKWEDGHLN